MSSLCGGLNEGKQKHPADIRLSTVCPPGGAVIQDMCSEDKYSTLVGFNTWL